MVSECGINANGSIELTKQLIDIAKNAGCDYIKFQKRDIDSCYSKEFLDSHRESPWGNTQRDQKQKLEFSLEDYRIIDEYSKELDIPWFSSPWDIRSVDRLLHFSLPYLKLASPIVTNKELVEYISETGIPLIISTGGCNLSLIHKTYFCPATFTFLGCRSSPSGFPFTQILTPVKASYVLFFLPVYTLRLELLRHAYLTSLPWGYPSDKNVLSMSFTF